MLKQILAVCVVVIGTNAHAFDPYDSEAAEAEYDESFLQVEECFADWVTDKEGCFITGIQQCIADLEAVLLRKGFEIPGGAGLSPDEYCNYIGLDRADAHLNAVYQRILEQGPYRPAPDLNVGAIANLRVAQRLWVQFSSEMCSENNIVGWHYGGSGWGAVTSECLTRLSIQQAGHLERYFTIID